MASTGRFNSIAYTYQLVVVGDQSTGKSSVLEAVTEIPFSADDEMCTRFATEIVLRRSGPSESTVIEVNIIPGQDESPNRKKTLLSWRPKRFDPQAELNKNTVKEFFKQVGYYIVQIQCPR